MRSTGCRSTLKCRGPVNCVNSVAWNGTKPSFFSGVWSNSARPAKFQISFSSSSIPTSSPWGAMARKPTCSPRPNSWRAPASASMKAIEVATSPITAPARSSAIPSSIFATGSATFTFMCALSNRLSSTPWQTSISPPSASQAAQACGWAAPNSPPSAFISAAGSPPTASPSISTPT
jgi:hypothetical protein